MTDKEKNQIAVYREQGLSYTKISKKMDLSINSIKTYCKRHGLGGVRAFEAVGKVKICACENCGKPVARTRDENKSAFVRINAEISGGTHTWIW